MKLSEKGFEKLANKRKALECGLIKFEPNDFENAVVLTVEEAKTIEHCFSIFQKHFKLFEPEMKVWQELRKRIEQAEKGHG